MSLTHPSRVSGVYIRVYRVSFQAGFRQKSCAWVPTFTKWAKSAWRTDRRRDDRRVPSSLDRPQLLQTAPVTPNCLDYSLVGSASVPSLLQTHSCRVKVPRCLISRQIASASSLCCALATARFFFGTTRPPSAIAESGRSAGCDDVLQPYRNYPGWLRLKRRARVRGEC